MAGILVLALCGCGADGGRGEAPDLVLVGSSGPIPYSANHSLAIVAPDRACVIESYETRVHCGDREWRDVRVIGRAGEGPGEFQTPLAVVRGPDGTFGVVDGGLSRFSVFDAGGTLAYSAPVPFLFRPMAPFDSLLSGNPSPPPWPPRPRSAGALYHVLALPSGEVVNEITLLNPSEAGAETGAPRGLGPGAVSRSGEITFITGGTEIVRYAATGELIDVFVAPTFTEELPNARDLDEFRHGAFLGARPTDAAVLAYARTPKNYVGRGPGSLRFDDHGRLWVMTQRDRDQSSWLDVYRGSTLLGSVQVRDRVYGFDLLGDQLAVLVERSALSAEGLPVRAIDWYAVR